MPVPGQYNKSAVDHTLKRNDLGIPDLKLYTPKNFGKTSTRQGNFLRDAPLDSFDSTIAFKSQINGITSSAHKRVIA